MKWQQKYDIANLIATVWNSIIYSKYRHNKHMKTLRFVGSVISVTVLSVLFHNKQYALIAFWLAQNVKRSHRKYDDFRSCSTYMFGFLHTLQMQSINDTHSQSSTRLRFIFQFTIFSHSHFYHYFSSCVAVCVPVAPLIWQTNPIYAPRNKKNWNKIW